MGASPLQDVAAAAASARPLSPQQQRDDALRLTASSLVQLIRRLRAQHRSEIIPTFGQLENLFDLATLLEQQLEVKASELVTVTCQAVEGCQQVGDYELVPGHFYCAAHARQVRQVLGQIGLGRINGTAARS